MNKGLNAVKNIIWVLCIFAAVTALLIGIVFSVSNRFYGERDSLALDISTGKQSTAKSGGIDSLPISAGTDTGASEGELTSTQDAGIEYPFSLTYLCDSTISGLNDFSASYGGTGKAVMWTDDGSGIKAENASKAMIISHADGSAITPVNAAMIYQPKRLVIYIGSVGLAEATQEGFTAGYTRLIEDIRAASPGTTIVCCSLASIAAAYTGSDGYTAEQFAAANEWIAAICRDKDVKFADLAARLNDSNGYMKAEFAAPDGRTLNSAGINELINYFRYHASI